MQGLIDTSLPADVTELLTTFGYDVRDCRALGLAQAPIAAAWQAACEHDRTLLTARWEGQVPPDLKDSCTPGVVIFRLDPDLSPGEIGTHVLEFLQAFCNEEWHERSALVTQQTHTIIPPVPRSDYADEPGMLG